MSDRSRFRNSIFTKLLLILITTGLFVQVIVILFIVVLFFPKPGGQIEKNLQRYSEFLAKEIGTPPDTVKAKQIAEKYSLTIEYEARNNHWVFNERVRSDSTLRKFFQFNRFVVNNPDGSKFIISTRFRPYVGSQRWNFIFLLAGIAAIVFVAYVLIRLLLQPIKALDMGVKQVARGNLEYRIESGRKDELGNLTRSYNEMSQKIKEMLHARDQLLRDVSHELRSPLTRMKVALEFLKPRTRVKSLAADIQDMEYLIQEILESEKLKNGYGKLNLQMHNIAEIVRSFSESFKGRKPGLTLVDIPERLMVNIDSERIRLSLKNIIENAFKYSKKDRRDIEMRVERGSGSVRIKISDDGIGIPREEIPYVFEPFYRVERSRSKKIGGYGLGLSICRTIIQAHGGSISLTPNQPRGTTVSIELPLHQVSQG